MVHFTWRCKLVACLDHASFFEPTKHQLNCRKHPVVGALLHAPPRSSAGGGLPHAQSNYESSRHKSSSHTPVTAASLHHLRHHPHVGSIRHSPGTQSHMRVFFSSPSPHASPSETRRPPSVAVASRAPLTEDDLYAPLVMRNTPEQRRRRPIMRSSLRAAGSLNAGRAGLCAPGSKPTSSSVGSSPLLKSSNAPGGVKCSASASGGLSQQTGRRLRLGSEGCDSTDSTPPRSTASSTGSSPHRPVRRSSGDSVGPILITTMQEQVMISHSLAAIGQRTRNSWLAEQRLHPTDRLAMSDSAAYTRHSREAARSLPTAAEITTVAKVAGPE